MISRIAIPTIPGPLHPRLAGAVRLGLALAAVAAGCGSPAVPPAARSPSPAARPDPLASPAAFPAKSDTCPPLADPPGWFGLGGSGPADDGVRAVAAGGGGGLATDLVAKDSRFRGKKVIRGTGKYEDGGGNTWE